MLIAATATWCCIWLASSTVALNLRPNDSAGALAPSVIRISIGLSLLLAVLVGAGLAALGASARPGLASAGAVVGVAGSAAAALAVVVELHTTPSRLVAIELGWLLVAVPLWWAVQRRSGGGVAALTVAAFSALTVWTAFNDVERRPGTTAAALSGPYRWSVGSATAAWAFAHEVDLPAERPSRIMLAVQRFGGYSGSSTVRATVNGIELEPLHEAEFDELAASVPEDLLRHAASARIELRVAPPDPRLRLVAQRWTGGATRGARASSYFDGFKWNTGTFDDVAGRHAPGVYVIELRPAR